MKILKLLGCIINRNRAKSIMLALLIPSIYCLCNFFYTTYEIVPLKMSKWEDGRVSYIYKSQDSYSLITFDKEMPIVKKKISYSSSSVIGVLSILSVGVCSVCLLIGLFSSENDINWEFKECKAESCISDVVLETEAGYYYYTYNGRLIYKQSVSNELLDRYNIVQLLKMYFRNGNNLYPLFETESRKRDKKLDKILN